MSTLLRNSITPSKYYTNFIPFKTIAEYSRGLIRDIGHLIDGNAMLARGMEFYVINLAGNEGGTTMAVSRGVGNSIIPFRFNNRPEIVLIELVTD